MRGYEGWWRVGGGLRRENYTTLHLSFLPIFILDFFVILMMVLYYEEGVGGGFLFI